MGRALAAAAAIVATLTPLVSACGGSDPPPEPQVAAIDEAIAAVEQRLGAPQRFYEISADLDSVRLFVATDGGPPPTSTATASWRDRRRR